MAASPWGDVRVRGATFYHKKRQHNMTERTYQALGFAGMAFNPAGTSTFGLKVLTNANN